MVFEQLVLNVNHSLPLFLSLHAGMNVWVCFGPFNNHCAHKARCAAELSLTAEGKTAVERAGQGLQNRREPDIEHQREQRVGHRDSRASPVKLRNGIWQKEPKRRHQWPSTKRPFFSKREDRD